MGSSSPKPRLLITIGSSLRINDFKLAHKTDDPRTIPKTSFSLQLFFREMLLLAGSKHLMKIKIFFTVNLCLCAMQT